MVGYIKQYILVSHHWTPLYFHAVVYYSAHRKALSCRCTSDCHLHVVRLIKRQLFRSLLTDGVIRL